MEGSDSPNFEYLDNSMSKHLTCPKCSHMFHKPTRVHPCGHTFCLSCVDGGKVRKCWVCTVAIVVKQPDFMAANLLLDMRVRCLNDGCPWKGNFDEFSQFHQKNCNLKNGGISGWLNKIQEVVHQSNMIISSNKTDSQQGPSSVHDPAIDCKEQKGQENKIQKYQGEEDCQDENIKEETAKQENMCSQIQIDPGQGSTQRKKLKLFPPVPVGVQSKHVQKQSTDKNNLDKGNGLSLRVNEMAQERKSQIQILIPKQRTVVEISESKLSIITSLTNKYLEKPEPPPPPPPPPISYMQYRRNLREKGYHQGLAQNYDQELGYDQGLGYKWKQNEYGLGYKKSPIFYKHRQQ